MLSQLQNTSFPILQEWAGGGRVGGGKLEWHILRGGGKGGAREYCSSSYAAFTNFIIRFISQENFKTLNPFLYSVKCAEILNV